MVGLIDKYVVIGTIMCGHVGWHVLLFPGVFD